MITDKIKALSNTYFEEIVTIRHKIHMNPELCFHEVATAQLISDVLRAHHIDTRTGIAGTGVVGLIQGKGPGKTVLLRADMDALPIQEDVDVPFKSTVAHRMHACGHDGHVAGLLGAAMILNELRDAFSGNVKLVFQPAEEAEGGAAKMIEAGVLEDPHVDAAFGCHLWGDLKEGRVHLCPGAMMAAPDAFTFRILGAGGHSSSPHLALDPIVMAAQAILFMQTIVSRRINPLEPGVLTISSVHSGESNNVIPDYLEATGTVRTFSEDLRDIIPREMENILKGVTEPVGASFSLAFRKGNPPLVNDERMTQVMCRAFAKVIGEDQVSANGARTMSSEDFAHFGKRVPSAFAFVGIAKDEANPMKHHQSHFQWEDKHLSTLAQGFAQVGIDFLAGG